MPKRLPPTDCPAASPLAEALAGLDVAVVLSDRGGLVTYASLAFRALLAGRLEGPLGRPLVEVLAALRGAIAPVQRREEIQLGTDRWVLLQHHHDGAGGLTVAVDISDAHHREQRLARLAFFDSLTSLPNAAWLAEHLDVLAEEVPEIALLHVSVDRMAAVRAGFGHSFADQLLAAAALRLMRIAAGRAGVIRLEGVSFAVLASAQVSNLQMETMATDLVEAFREPFVIDERAVVVGVHVGMARGPAEIRTLDDARIAADHALGRGSGAPVLFQEAMRHRFAASQQIESDLRRALAVEDQLWLAYQPIYRLADATLAGYEALVRWNHPERGACSPGEFIPVAEQSGLVVPLGRRVLEVACRQIAAWGAEFDAFVSVNLSAIQMRHPGLVDTVRAALHDNGIDGSRLKLELTESAVMENVDDAIPVLQALRGLGVKLSIDDFGTGYSSLSYLHRLPIDSLKIDQSFIRVLHEKPESRELVRIMTDLGHILGLEVVAEGIEHRSDLETLNTLGCDLGQGWYFSKAVPPDQAIALWRKAPTAQS